MARNTVSRWENQDVIPRDGDLRRAIARALDVRFEWLETGEEPMRVADQPTPTSPPLRVAEPSPTLFAQSYPEHVLFLAGKIAQLAEDIGRASAQQLAAARDIGQRSAAEVAIVEPQQARFEPKIVGENVTLHREAQRMSLGELARKTKLGGAESVRKIEQGSWPKDSEDFSRHELVERLARALRTTPDRLLGYMRAPEHSSP